MLNLRALIPLALLVLSFGVAALYSPPEDLMRGAPLAAPPPVEWYLPPGTSTVPFVLLLEDPDVTGRSSPWTDWLLRHGIAVARARGETQTALEQARRLPRIDARHFAVIGAGRQAAVALNSAPVFAPGPMPTAVFALAPRCILPCASTYPADGPTQVHLLRGHGEDALAIEIARSTVLATLVLAWQIDN
jgi:hypothetical protein